jgi:hypothetical protein
MHASGMRIVTGTDSHGIQQVSRQVSRNSFSLLRQSVP